MNQPVSVNPDGLNNAANQFDDIEDKTKQILSTLQAGCSAEGTPWGDDKAGKQFADGDKGYLTNRDGTFKSLSQVADVFGQNRDNLRDTVKTFEQNEAQAAKSTPQGQGGSSGSGSYGSGNSGSGSSTYYPTAYRRLQAINAQIQPETARQAQTLQPRQSGTLTPEQPAQPRQSGTLTPEQPAQPRQSGTLTPEQPAQPRQSGTLTPEQPAQLLRSGTLTPEQPAQLLRSGTLTPEQPAQPRQYNVGTPATYQPVEGQRVEGQRVEALPETPVQPRIYEDSVPATPETYRGIEEPLLPEQTAFARIQAQPVRPAEPQPPNQG